jgi:hypothetical protein
MNNPTKTPKKLEKIFRKISKSLDKGNELFIFDVSSGRKIRKASVCGNSTMEQIFIKEMVRDMMFDDSIIRFVVTEVDQKTFKSTTLMSFDSSKYRKKHKK